MAELGHFPLVAIDPVANAQNEWVALSLRLGSGLSQDRGAQAARELQAVFGQPDLLAAIAPLDCLLNLDSVEALTAPVLALLPPGRVGLVIGAASLALDAAPGRLAELAGGALLGRSHVGRRRPGRPGPDRG